MLLRGPFAFDARRALFRGRAPLRRDGRERHALLMLGAVDRAAVDARRLVLCHQPAAQYSLVSQALLPQGAW